MSKKNQFKVGIKNVVIADNPNDSVLEIHFLDVIYNEVVFDWWTGAVYESNMVEEVITQVKAAQPSKIKLIIDSQGGDAQIGLTLYNFFKAYNAKIEVEVIGMAGSIASVIAMAANKGKLTMARNAFMIIHRAWGGASGNSEDLRAAADMIDKYTGQICDIYSQRIGKSKEEIETLIAKGDYWMTGTEAKEQGFCDSLLNDNASFQIAARINNLDGNYKNIPSSIKAEQPTNNTTIFQTLQSEIMNIKSLVSNFISGLKGGTPPANETKPEEGKPGTDPKASAEGKPAAETTEQGSVFASLIEKPLTDFLTDLQKEVSNMISKDNDTFKAAVLNLVKEDEGFRKEVSNLIKESEEVKNLTEQIKNLDGGESAGEKNDAGGKPKNKVVGRFV